MTTTRRVGNIDARYMTHPERTHTSGDPCPVGLFPHPAEPACSDVSRTYVIDVETIEAECNRRDRGRYSEAIHGARVFRALFADPKYAHFTGKQLDAYARDFATMGR